MSKEKTIEYYKGNAEEDYLNTPISVLRYITELESLQQKHKEELKEAVINAWNSAYGGDAHYDAEAYYNKEHLNK